MTGKGSEAGFDVVARVVAEVDVDLGGPGVGAGVGEGDVAEGVGLLQRVVGDDDVALLLGDRRVAVEAELDPAAGHDAEETGVVVVLCTDERVEAIGAVRGPVAVGLDDEISGSSLEFYPEGFGGFVVPDR